MYSGFNYSQNNKFIFVFYSKLFINYRSLYTYMFYSTMANNLLIIYVDSEQLMNVLFLKWC